MKRATAIKKDKSKWTAKEMMLYTAGSIVLLGGGFLLARHIVQTENEKRVEKKSAEEGSPESYVKALKMAFENDGWPGTNMPEVRRVFQEIPSKEFYREVSSKYQKLYHRPLTSDLSSELQSSEINEVLSILAAKPDKLLSKGNKPMYNFSAWAKRLKAAFDKTYGFIPGTDEPAIKAVFYEIPTQAAFLQVANAYLNEYHSNLLDDLRGELEIWEYPDYMRIITNKPKN